MNLPEMFALSDTGYRRRHNEDCVRIVPDHGIAILADGMGGHQAGEVASAMASESIAQKLQERRQPASLSARLEQAVESANRTVFDASRQRPEYVGMATTLVVALFHGNRLCIAHIGDSRMYRLRDGLLTHMTEDHSLVQEQLRRGLLTPDEARHASNRNQITRALGIDRDVEPDLIEENSQPDDLYLLCSDGLTTVVPDEAIRLLLIEHGHDLRKASGELITMANDAGGPDNISVILIRTNHPQQPEGKLSRLLRVR